MVQKITICNLQKPNEVNLQNDIEWLGDSLSFSAGRDTDRVTAKILNEVLENISKKGNTTTEEISKNLNYDVQKINYHLRTLIDSGFICREKRIIILRQGSVKSAIEEMRKDTNRIFDDLSNIAEEIDVSLGLKNRK